MQFPKGISVLTFVVLNGDKTVRSFRSTQGDLVKHLPVMKNGVPVIGPNVYREMTHKEIKEKHGLENEKAAKRLKAENYAQTLVSVCNTQGNTIGC